MMSFATPSPCKVTLKLASRLNLEIDHLITHFELLCTGYFPGEVFFTSDYDSFSYEEAVQHCEKLNSTLAAPGQLYAAWRKGLDKCRPGWLMDRSVRYPVTSPRAHCGGGQVGVQIIHAFPNQTGFPDEHSRYDAYCYRGTTLLTLVALSFFFPFGWLVLF